MPAMVTVLTEFADNGNSRTYTTSGHTVTKPKLVIQKRKVPSGNQVVAEVVFMTVHGTEDADGNPMAQKVVFETRVRYPLGYLAADLAAAQAIHQDIVQSTEFGTSVTSQNWLK